MHHRHPKDRRGFAVALAVLMAMAVNLLTPSPLRGQNLISVIYGNGKRVLLKDCNFEYAFYESDQPIVFCYECNEPVLQTKASEDLHLTEQSSGSDSPTSEPIIFRLDELDTIRINIKKYSLYDRRGRIVRRTIPGFDEVEDVTIIPVRGRERTFRFLRAQKSFLSSKEHVWVVGISITGHVLGKAAPELYGVRLNLRHVPAKRGEQVVEIRFREY